MTKMSNEDYEDYREVRRCETDCSHFDLINSCCWLMTENTGLFTDVEQYDYCFHGIKEEG